MADDESNENTLDRTATATQAGRATVDELVAAFLDAPVVLPSATDPMTSPTQPVLVTIDGIQHVVIFDSLATAGQVSHLARYAASMRGRDALRGVRPGLGVLVRTAHSGFDLSPQLLDEIRAKQTSGE
ncbi:hypothetical protein ACFC1I_12310 [Microbacterium sp. NPDC056044]|uniref:hypothetical protein n=1 Tax=Microbacterium sp. NPDC056044 TaxID=3345690 RepID=UPI0035D61EAB